MEEFKKVLAEEASFKLSDETMNRFCSLMEEVHLKRYDYMIKSGDLDDNIYIVKDGVVRRTHQDGEKIITNSFAIKGSVLMSWHCYYFNQPSYSQFQACCDTIVMRVPRVKFDELIAGSHEFAQWVLSLAHGTLYYQEFKSRIIKGDVKERYISLIKNRPEIIQKVPLGFIASYLGITQSHLSRMRNELAKGK
ncbi:MAG: Crp/Fnr family transcriptional regulator [Bacteroidaceae bacterium]|nr:Crp/Fnr family transcriptional regulator [Bacteroidaceae bacterium]